MTIETRNQESGDKFIPRTQAERMLFFDNCRLWHENTWLWRIVIALAVTNAAALTSVFVNR